jgi:AraC-like DNA-binding protein
MRFLSRSLGDELWGLCPNPVPIGSFAQACRIMVRCRNLGEAIRTGLRHYRLLVHDFVPRLHVASGVARISLMPRWPMEPALAYAERCFCYQAYGLLCWLVATRLPVLAVELPEADSRRTSHATLLFHAPMERVRHRTGIRLDAKLLELPIVQNEESLRAFLRQAPAILLARYRDRSTVTEQVRRILTVHLAGELPSFEIVGERLGMTTSTLRRRLRQERQSFGKIKDDLRRDAAIGYLARPEFTLPEIAGLVGFSEASTFHRAFKQWTGMAPGEYRKSRLGAR